MLAAWARSHPDVVVLGVALDADPEVVRRFVAQRDLPYPILLDPQREVAAAYHVDTYPTTVRVSATGEVRGSHTGVVFGPQLDLMEWW